MFTVENPTMRSDRLILAKDGIVVPRFTKPYPLVVRLDLIGKLDARIAEVAWVTRDKAQELLSVLNIGWQDLHETVTLLEHELNLATDNLTKVKARVLLDKVLPKLKEENLPGAKDIRDALVEADEEVQAAAARKYEIQCVSRLMAGKLKSTQMAFESVKKVLGENAFGGGHNPNLSAGAESNVGVGMGDRPEFMGGAEVVLDGFGKSKYNY